MKTFEKFNQYLQESFITLADARKAYYEGVRDGTIGKCSNCGSPNLTKIQDGGCRTCVDCGNKDAKWRIKLKEAREEECEHCGQTYPEGDPHHCWQSGHHNEHNNGPKKPKKVSEDEGGDSGGSLPTNSAGSANIAGIGIQRKGEPSFAEPGVPVRKKLKIVGPDPVDPRIFSDKIFGHSKLADTIHKTGVK